MKSGARVLWLVRLAIALDALLYSGLIPLLPQMGINQHLSDGELGLLLGIFPLAGLFACVPMGILADGWRPGPLVAAGMIGSALGSIAIALWPHPLVIALARFAQGVAGSAVWTAGFALVHQNAAPNEESREIGLSYSASSMGEMSGPLLSGFLAERVSAAAFFWVAGLVSAVGGSLLGLHKSRKLGWPARAATEPKSRREDVALLAGGAALAVVINGIYGGLLILAPLLLARDYRLDAFAIGQVFLAFHLVLIISQTGGGHWGDRVPRVVPIVAGSLAMAAGLLVMSAAQSLAVSLAGMALAGAGSGVAVTVATPVFSEAWANVRPAGSGVGLAFGVILTVGTIGFTLGNMLGGALLADFSMPGILVGAAAVALVTGLGTIVVGKFLIIRPVIVPVD